MWRWKAGVLQTSRQGGREAELVILKSLFGVLKFQCQTLCVDQSLN